MLITLPEKYYLAHARELFSFVEDHCTHLLSKQHRHYLRGFTRLSDDAQCLLIRMLTRKPRFLSRQSLVYSEIDNFDLAVDELINLNYASTVRAEDWPEFVAVLTKSQLLSCFENFPLKVKSATPKAELVAMAQRAFNGEDPALAGLRKAWMVRRQQEVSDFILFLYFGDLNNRLQKFAMRDLGVLKTRKTEGNTVARFKFQDEAQSAFKFHQLRRDYRQKAAQIRETTIDYLLQNTPIGESSTKVRDKLLLQVAQDIYLSEPAVAIQLWRHSEHSSALEKWVRASYQHLCRESLQRELESLRKLPLTAVSKVFLEDFYQRKYQGKRTSVYTDMLREPANEMAIDECYLGAVEEGVLQRYRQQRIEAWFTENKLWHALFAFYLWPFLFGEDQPQHTEFDYLPAALRDPNFYSRNASEIEQRLNHLSCRATALREVTQLATKYYGMPTGLFRWTPTLLSIIKPCVQFAPPGALTAVIREMAGDFVNCASGYPDLMVYEAEQLRFEEVKAPGDVLRPNQLLSIQRLRNAGLEVGLCQVTWATDPQQVYAVVDIETTGGRRSGNAITEIAVVRVQNQKIIDQWSTLINPGRPIPAHITRLTGINNQMVAGAPAFSEIADQLDQQLEQSVFVAHNVGFDYGFIKAAYESIGRKFKKPKYCTVQQARKAFPGLRSYSLGNLAAAFDLDLKNAHRALDDAKATAELLLLIQEAKRA